MNCHCSYMKWGLRHQVWCHLCESLWSIEADEQLQSKIDQWVWHCAASAIAWITAGRVWPTSHSMLPVNRLYAVTSAGKDSNSSEAGARHNPSTIGVVACCDWTPHARPAVDQYIRSESLLLCRRFVFPPLQDSGQWAQGRSSWRGCTIPSRAMGLNVLYPGRADVKYMVRSWEE